MKMQNRSILALALTAGIAVASVPSANATCEIPLKGLEEKMMKSGLSAELLFLASMNRLGYGVNSRSTLNMRTIKLAEENLGRRAAIDIMAAEIRRSFNSADKVSTAIMDEVATIFPNTYEAGFRGDMSALHEFRLSLPEVDRLAPPVPGVDNRKLHDTRMKRALVARKFLAALRTKNYNVGEVLGDFWFNHFNVAEQKNTAQDYELEIRGGVCGTFRGMLLRTARHPAMNAYLNNSTNMVGKINENYGREIIELHTLGTGPILRFAQDGRPLFAYTQDDVYEASRVLSGWGSMQFQDVAFLYKDSRHDQGVKKFGILFQPLYGMEANVSKEYPAGGGESEGVQFIADLARHPLTQKNICRKLGRHLLGRGAPHSLVEACVAAWGRDGDLEKMYSAFLVSDEFWNAEDAFKGFKTPFELTISAMRALGLAPEATLDPAIPNRSFLERYAVKGLAVMGQELFHIMPPTGYEVGAAAWASPSYVSQGMESVYSMSTYGALAAAGKEGAELEAFVNELKLTNEERFDYILRKISPSFGSLDGSVLKKRIVRALDTGKADTFRGKPLPVRTVLTQVASSAAFMKK